MINGNTKPKSALVAYCALADRLRKPGFGLMQALTPFIAEACQQFAGELFDASKLSGAVAERYGIRIPRLAALGLSEQLARDGLLVPYSGSGSSTIYQYATPTALIDAIPSSPVTETEVELVLASFLRFCRTDSKLDERDDASLEKSFLDRLLNTESMRILGRRETSIQVKRTPDTLMLKSQPQVEKRESEEIHLDFIVSSFLLDMRNGNATAFERISNVAFANMAAEAIACFREPATNGNTLAELTVYLDSPLLLDMLGVNGEYADYGNELLDAIRAAGARAAVFDHCVAEAETAISAQLNYLRAGINQAATRWGTTATLDLLSALVNHVGERAETRLGISVHRDPEVNLHRRGPSAATTVGDIEASMITKMQAWRSEEAKEHDRKSVWSMLAIRDGSNPCPRLCDCKWLLLTRNTALVAIANTAWTTWLKGATKHSSSNIERWAPVAMSDKQFAGYLWTRTGGADGQISKTRLLAHCSAAVRPRADVKARAYNLMVELSGNAAADDIAALLEDREGANALMRATWGDPEDVTRERWPYILEKVKLAAGQYAAAAVREEAEKQLEEQRIAYDQAVKYMSEQVASTEAARIAQEQEATRERLQREHEREELERQNLSLRRILEEQTATEKTRRSNILLAGFVAGRLVYRLCRWGAALLFGILSWAAAMLSAVEPMYAAGLSFIIGIVGFWFVPELLHGPINTLATNRFRAVIRSKDAGLEIPNAQPDFREGRWDEINVLREKTDRIG